MIEIPFERHRLANGLRIVLAPDDTAPIVGVNLWYGVGSRNEPEGLTGFAHLFEHMMFQGSEHVPKNRHFELVERAGGSLNASTWFDRTNYYETLPSHHLELALWLEADRMGWMLPAMTQEKLDNQRDVVKNERRWRYDNQPYGDWDERMQALVYPDTHPYHHTVIGSMEDIDAASLEDVSEFFRTFYLPNNAVLTVCGDFERETALAMIERNFGEIPAGPQVPELPGEPDVDPLLGVSVFERVEAQVPLPRVYVGLRVPRFTDPRFHAADVAFGVLASGRASRLYSRLIREQRIAKDVAGFVFPIDTGAALAVVWATGLPHVDPDTLEQAVLAELDGLEDVRGGEVERAVALAETRLLSSVEEIGERADLLSMFEHYFEDPGRLSGEIDRLREVGADDVEAFAREFLGSENRAVLTYLPENGE
ncbi:MAG: pitrilysin family protein [Gemmatimonadota bacterium]|nr:insulinase family protein [Gemmatimonadota bacterium]